MTGQTSQLLDCSNAACGNSKRYRKREAGDLAMSVAENQPDNSGSLFEQVLAEYLRRVDQRDKFDHDEFLAAHPDILGLADKARGCFRGLTTDSRRLKCRFQRFAKHVALIDTDVGLGSMSLPDQPTQVRSNRNRNDVSDHSRRCGPIAASALPHLPKASLEHWRCQVVHAEKLRALA